MVVIDATMLLLMLRPGTSVPAAPGGLPIDKPKERIDHLVAQLERSHSKLIIPTPALSEVLVRAGTAASQQIVDQLTKWSVFQIVPFDTKAAIEVAAMTRGAIATGKKKGTSNATWAKVKYDRQIVAIAKVAGATTIYSDDADIKTLATQSKIPVKGLADLPLPPQDPQLNLLANISPAGVNVGDLFDDKSRPDTEPREG